MNKSVFRRIICVMLCVIFSCGTISVIAKTKSEIQSELNKKNEEKQEIKERIAETKEKKETTLQQKNAVESEIDIVNSEISDLQAIINDANSRIEAKEVEINTLQGKMDAQNEVFKVRVRVMYENQNADYLQVLLSAKSISDFLMKMDYITQILANDKDILETMSATKQEMEAAKMVIVDEKESNEAAKAMVEEKRNQLKEKERQQQQLINGLKAQEEADAAELKKIEEAEQELRNQIKNLDTSGIGVPAKFSGGQFCWPSESSTVITSSFGGRTHPVTGVYKLHTGIDIGAGYGTNSLAAADGVVTMAGWHTAYGNYIVINHGGGVSTLYAHHSSILVSRGQSVTRGQKIGKVGSTGYSTGPHLHFEVLINGNPVNPMNYF